MTIVKAAITQTTWTGDKESMLDKHEQFARQAKEQGAQVICFQELFYGPYFGITEDVKYYDYAEPADGPIVQRFAKLAKDPDWQQGNARIGGIAAIRSAQETEKFVREQYELYDGLVRTLGLRH